MTLVRCDGEINGHQCRNFLDDENLTVGQFCEIVNTKYGDVKQCYCKECGD